MIVNNSLCDVQPEPSPFSPHFRIRSAPRELLKQPAYGFLRHPYTRICYGKLNRVRLLLQRDDNVTYFCIFKGVIDQVENNFTQLRLITPDHHWLAFILPDDLDSPVVSRDPKFLDRKIDELIKIKFPESVLHPSCFDPRHV